MTTPKKPAASVPPPPANSPPIAADRGPRRGIPTLRAIAEHWIGQEERFPENRAHSIGLGEPYCFACGWLAPVDDTGTLAAVWASASGLLERAHLVDRGRGGPDTVDNMVVLCCPCHGEMPSFGDVELALHWVRAHEMSTDRFARWFERRLYLLMIDGDRAVPTERRWLEEMAEVCKATCGAALLEIYRKKFEAHPPAGEWRSDDELEREYQRAFWRWELEWGSTRSAPPEA